MSEWDSIRDQLKAKQAESAEAVTRARQELEIVQHQQGALWSSLTQEFVNAIAIINGPDRILTYTDALKTASIKVTALRSGDSPQATVTFDGNRNCVTVSYAGRNSVDQYLIQANNNNRAEFRRGDNPLTAKDIVDDVLSGLV